MAEELGVSGRRGEEAGEDSKNSLKTARERKIAECDFPSRRHVICNDVTDGFKGKTPARIAKTTFSQLFSQSSGSARWSAAGPAAEPRLVRNFYTGIAPPTVRRLHFATCIPFTLRANSVSFFGRRAEGPERDGLALSQLLSHLCDSAADSAI
jgi:hypothetical protein